MNVHALLRCATCSLCLLLLTGCAAYRLQTAVLANNTDDVRRLLDRGVDVNVVIANGTTPLHVAAAEAKIQVAALLVSRGANVDARQRNGWSPIMFAAQTGCVEIAELLVRKGADINAMNSGGATPLHIACFHGKTEAVSFLLGAGANPYVVARDGSTPLMYAEHNNHLEAAELLAAATTAQNPFLVRTDRTTWSDLPDVIIQYNIRQMRDFAGHLPGAALRAGSRRGSFGEFVPNKDEEFLMDSRTGEVYLELAKPKVGGLGQVSRSPIAGVYVKERGGPVIHVLEKFGGRAPHTTSGPPSPAPGTSRTDILPAFAYRLRGPELYGEEADIVEYEYADAGRGMYVFRPMPLREVRVRNPNDFRVTVGLRQGAKGKDFVVEGNGQASAYVPDGKYDIFFVYSNKPNALFQGDSFTLDGNGVEIKIVKVVGGNYGIRQVK